MSVAVVGCGGGTVRSLVVQAYADAPLQFGPCPSDLPAAGLGECALAEAPLDWSRAGTSQRISLFLRRFRSSITREGSRQVWALDGGPGFAGDVFTDPAIRDVVLNAGFDLYIPSHRGTVYGTSLACPAQQAPESEAGGLVTAGELPACVEALQVRWGEGLPFFGSDSAARDVRHLIERSTSEPVRRVVVYGGSYGSYWGQRLLQVAPDRIAGMWLDSIVDLEASFERADDSANAAGLRLLGACGAHPECSARLSASTGGVGAQVRQVAGDYAAGRGCGQRGRPQARMQALFYRLLDAPPYEQALVAPLLARAARCSSRDEAAIEHALAELEVPPPSAEARPPAYNHLLNRHVLLSELYRYGRSPAEVVRDSQGYLFSAHADEPMAALALAYDASLRRVLPQETPATDAHLVLWQGGFDPLDRVEWAARAAKRWSAGQVSVVELPFAGHSVVRYAVAEDGTRCATEMLHGFLSNPERALDRSCLERLPGFDWGARLPRTLEAAERWFGVADAWGGPNEPGAGG